MDKNHIKIRLVQIEDLNTEVLEKFNRYQVTNRVRYKENDEYFYKDDHFIDFWNEEKKAQVIESLQNCVSKGGIVTGAFIDDKLIGFANVESEFFGRNSEYLELPYIHVSNEYRNCGIGKKLFNLCCKEAKAKGAKKLYIAAHPAEETQDFYRAMGCVLALEINEKIYKLEPLDIQLEFVL